MKTMLNKKLFKVDNGYVVVGEFDTEIKQGNYFYDKEFKWNVVPMARYDMKSKNIAPIISATANLNLKNIPILELPDEMQGNKALNKEQKEAKITDKERIDRLTAALDRTRSQRDKYQHQAVHYKEKSDRLRRELFELKSKVFEILNRLLDALDSVELSSETEEIIAPLMAEAEIILKEATEL